MDSLGLYRVGDVICNRYRVDRTVAAFPNGILYHCVDTRAENRLVTARALFPELLQEEAFRYRLSRSAVAAILAIDHPNVRKILDVYHHEQEAGHVIERIGTRTVEDLLLEGTTIDLVGLLELLSMILDGLQAIHESEILHLNLTPDRMYLIRYLLSRRDWVSAADGSSSVSQL